MDMTRLDLNETDHPVEGVYNMEIRVWETSTGMCCKNTLMLSQFTKESRSNSSVRVWLEKRKEVWVALHTFCKLLKTVVKPASVKPTVNLECTLLFLSKLTSSFSLTSLPLECGLYTKLRSPTHIPCSTKVVPCGSSLPSKPSHEKAGHTKKRPYAKIRLLHSLSTLWDITNFPC